MDRMTLAMTASAALGAAVGTLVATPYLARRRRAIDFADRVVLVTGGSRGLGLELARQFGAEGARLAILARDEQALGRAADELAGLGTDVLALTCDLRKPDEVRRAVGETIERLGRLDVLVNNAGIIQVGPLAHMSAQDFEEAMDVHFRGPLHAILTALPQLRRTRGRIVNIASIGGKLPVPHLAPYCASKHALVGLSQSLRVELAREGVLVTTVSPGLMRTGSPPNALVKGQHAREYAWFVVFDSIPLASIDARRAAAQIVDACRHGDAELVITPQARFAACLNGVAPGLTAALMSLASRALPGTAPAEGDQARRGGDVRPRWLPGFATRLTDRAAARNNEAARVTA